MIKSQKIKLRTGKYMMPVELEVKGERVIVRFAFNRKLLNEVRMMEGAKWHGYDDVNPRKVWSIANSPRNEFQLRYLMGEDPYEFYDRPLVDYHFTR